MQSVVCANLVVQVTIAAATESSSTPKAHPFRDLRALQQDLFVLTEFATFL
jgi:hypothetical protein